MTQITGSFKDTAVAISSPVIRNAPEMRSSRMIKAIMYCKFVIQIAPGPKVQENSPNPKRIRKTSTFFGQKNHRQPWQPIQFHLLESDQLRQPQWLRVHSSLGTQQQWMEIGQTCRWYMMVCHVRGGMKEGDTKYSFFGKCNKGHGWSTCPPTNLHPPNK